MRDLVPLIIAGMERGEAPSLPLLARLGVADPLRGSQALLRAATVPDLAARLEEWVPSILLAAHLDRGAERLADFVTQLGSSGGARLESRQLASMAALLGTGDMFAEWLNQRPDWAAGLVDRSDDEAKPPPPDWQEIRDAHSLGLLRIAARHLLGASLDESFEDLSKLVDACVESALDCASGEAGIAAPGAFAWGRLGAREPGICCPLEVLFVDAAASAEIEWQRAAECAQLATRLLEELPQGSDGGLTYAFGPRAASPPGADSLVAPLSSALAPWRVRREAAQGGALLSLRQLAGPPALGVALEAEVRGLLGRYALCDAGASAHPQIRRSRSRELGDFDVIDEDLLAGPCGIGRLERLTRSLQLESGQLAARSIPEAIFVLERAGEFSESESKQLMSAHSWLRRAEHGLGLLGATSATVPRDTDGQVALARVMGYPEADATRALARFLSDWRIARDQVHELAERVLRRGAD